MISLITLLQLAQIQTNAIPKPRLDSDQVGNLYGGALAVAGIVAVIFIIVGGIKYTLSSGDSQEVTKAKNTILYALIGLVVVLSAFVIVRIVTGLV